MVFPVVVGGGKRLFPDSSEKRSLKLVETEKRSLKLVEAKPFDSGVVVHTYHSAR